MSYTVAVDSGGTFSDCVALSDTGVLTRAKAPSTPPDFERGVLDAVAEVAAKLGLAREELLASTEVFAHGTTVATNVLITRTGAKTALLTTKGHEDAIIIGRTVQKVAGLSEDEIIDVARLSKADPLVPRRRILGLAERVDRAGEVVVPLRPERLDGLAERLRAEGVESVAVSLLWSFLNPAHERLVRSLLEAEDGPFVTLSSELAPVLREYERTSTTVLNAYLTPAVSRYLGRMRDGLRAAGHRGAVTVMHSAGGVSSVDEAGRRGVSLLSSGPAGGMLATRMLARRLGLDPVLATDVGGTSFDVGLVIGGEPSYAETPVYDKYPVTLPTIDVPSVGAGGGSIGWVEPDTGVLRVGPRSAGARPGPACYGAGGTEPTVTDANVVLGRIDPERFLGGRMPLDAARAHAAVAEALAKPLGMAVEQAAAAMIDIVDAQMADLVRRVTVARGLDPSGFAVFAYGGAAGLHADAYASRLGCREVVIPRAAAVFSALGIASSDVKRVELVSDPAPAPFDLDRWRGHFDRLSARLRDGMASEGLPVASMHLRRAVDLQFRGQVHAVRVPVEPEDLSRADGGEAVIDRFTELYEARYGAGTAYRAAGVEAMVFSVEATAALPVPALDHLDDEGGDPAAARVRERPVYLGDVTPESVPVYAADLLRPGHRVDGPLLVESEDTTVLVRAGHELWVDGLLNLRIDLTGAGG
ncbi:hydantoinase/oxoprolinase family protein [Pseudonocardia acaciae]|uniref:hydantoinase/oxoprolinase family protein n=1 Tax=Pseudonocardia acaciae TaxID=551276 RepID=UPI00048A5936|nr:hydantoinase/oxoprolinase family protein [Pseudonocardia acaciae]